MIEYQIIIPVFIIVAIIAFVLFITGILSYRTVKDTRLLSITLAFGVFFVKNLLIACSLAFDLVEHGDLELVDAIFDLITILLLFFPILFKSNITENRSESNES